MRIRVRLIVENLFRGPRAVLLLLGLLLGEGRKLEGGGRVGVEGGRHLDRGWGGRERIVILIVIVMIVLLLLLMLMLVLGMSRLR